MTRTLIVAITLACLTGAGCAQTTPTKGNIHAFCVGVYDQVPQPATPKKEWVHNCETTLQRAFQLEQEQQQPDDGDTSGGVGL